MAGQRGKVMAAEALGALWVGVTAMLAITIYYAISLSTGIRFAPWILFMAFPPAFLFGTSCKHIIPQIINVLCGYLIGGLLSTVITGQIMASTGVWAIGISACICTFLLQFLFQGPLGPSGLFKGWLSYTPWAFLGMITCFATGGTDVAVVMVDLALCIPLSVFVVFGCKLMAKVCGLGAPAPEEDKIEETQDVEK